MNSVPAEVWSIFVLSLGVSGTAVMVSCAAGMPMGVWLGLHDFSGKSIVRALIFTGMAVPPVVVGLLLYLLLSRSGPLGSWEWLFTRRAMILAQVLLDLPFVVGITMTAIDAIPRELLFQLRSLGASSWQLRCTLLSEAEPGLLLAFATALGRSISEVGAVLIVGGNIGGHTRVMTTAIVLETSRGHFAMAVGLGAILLLVALLINFLVACLQGRIAQ